jgi:transposase-like protein
MSKVDRNNPQRALSSESRYTLMDFDRDFPDDAACMAWLVGHLYPDGIFCPKCGKVTKHHRVAKRTSYACQFCGHQEYPLAGTIFQDSATSLKLWFHAFFLMAQTRCGISAKQLERELGVTYKTAWRMFRKIRSLLQDEGEPPLSGEVEADETYFSASKRLGDPRRSGLMKNKRVVMGAVERKGRVIARHVPTAGDLAGEAHVRQFVLPGSVVYTDEWRGYDYLSRAGYGHRRINHSERVYVSGDVHTQTIEGFWSLLKRGLSGVYHAVGSDYLQSYVDEYAWRYNHRRDPRGTFTLLLARIVSVATSDSPSVATKFPTDGHDVAGG